MSDEFKELMRLARVYVEHPTIHLARLELQQAMYSMRPEEMAQGLVFLSDALGTEVQNAKRRGW